MEDLERLEGTDAATILEREMLRWIERVEKAQRGQPRAKRSSTEALREVREERHAGRNGLPRRESRAQTPRRRRG